jgi:cytochrome P450
MRGAELCTTLTSMKTVSAFESFVLAMIKYPEVQKKAQSFIDSTIGGSRLPELSDRGRIPYLEALFYELMRWNPVTPLGKSHGIPHL